MKGYIERIPKDKQFGFIRSEDLTRDYFFHRGDFDGHWDDLVLDFNNSRKKDKIRVEFEVAESNKGPRAKNVKRLDWPNQYPKEEK